MSRSKMADVARAAGVSKMTVSRALREGSVIAPATRQRILAVVERLGYAPEEAARNLSSRRSGFVAALVPSLNNPQFAETVRALTETVEGSGLQVLIGHTNYEAAREERLVGEFLRRRPEALVVTVDGHSAATRRMLAAADVPVVEMWDWPTRPVRHVVGFSNRDAARDLTRHLSERGYRRIAFVGETESDGTRGAKRRDGYAAAIRRSGLGPPRIHNHAPPPISMLQGRDALREVLRQWPDVDAVMCVSDPCAFGVLTQAQAQGIDVPGRLAVAGFGDFEVSRCCLPALTTVVVDAAEIGRRAGLLVASLRGRGNEGAVRKQELIRIPVRVEPRGSTGG